MTNDLHKTFCTKLKSPLSSVRFGAGAKSNSDPIPNNIYKVPNCNNINRLLVRGYMSKYCGFIGIIL